MCGAGCVYGSMTILQLLPCTVKCILHAILVCVTMHIMLRLILYTVHDQLKHDSVTLYTKGSDTA